MPTVFFDIDRVDKDTTVRIGVAIILWDEQKRLLLECRSDCGLWGLPGGKIEPGESIVDTVIREAKEETGLDVSVTRLLGVYSGPVDRVVVFPDRVVQLIDIAVEAKITSGVLSRSCESLDIQFFALEDLPEDIVPPARLIIQDAIQGIISAIR